MASLSAPARIAPEPYAFAAAQRLRGELGVSETLAQVLVRRGHATPDAARRWLAADVRHPLDAFGGLREAAEHILDHVRRGSRITVHGDYDVDGVCSTAVLLRALASVGARPDWYLPSRDGDGYGLAAATVERLAQRGTQLLITVDCAITAVEEVALAKRLGMDVVVTDHHTPRADGALPDAPIVHPRLGGHPFGDLCAAGVAHKLAAALLEAAGADPALADEDLDLVALATVADVVALVDENRRLVRDGLHALARTRKPGLRALMRVSQVDPGELDASCIGFRLAPRINAAGRLRRADAGLELVLCGDEDRAQEIAAELDAMNRERRDVETRIRFAAEAQVAEQGDQPAYVLCGEDWHPGVVGIVASRIAERHCRPAVLIAMDPETGEGTGSGRSIPAFDLLAGLDAASAHLLRHGGHRAAAGLTIAREEVEAFRAAFAAHAAATLRPEDLLPVERVDAVVPGDVLGLELAEELAALEPFGHGNPPVSLLVAGATLSDPRSLGEGRHLSCTLTAGGARSKLMCFGAGASLPAAEEERIDAVVSLELNRWNGTLEPRLLLKRCRPVHCGGIQVVGEPAPPGADEQADAGAPTASPASLGPGEPLDAGAPTASPGPGGPLDSGASPADAYLAAVLSEIAAPLMPAAPAGDSGREQRDVRGRGLAGTIGDLVASGEPVLVVAAHARRRADALRDCTGGFAVTSWSGLVRSPRLAHDYPHVVALDPPVLAHQRAIALRGTGQGYLHWAWGRPEIDFALRVHQWEYELDAPLRALYRDLRSAGRSAGPSLGAALAAAGAGPARCAAHAGRLLRVLLELELLELEPGAMAVLVPATAPRTELERSAAYRAYLRRREDGERFLTSHTLPTAA